MLIGLCIYHGDLILKYFILQNPGSYKKRVGMPTLASRATSGVAKTRGGVRAFYRLLPACSVAKVGKPLVCGRAAALRNSYHYFSEKPATFSPK
jgi:hypothetical protein